MNNKPFELRRQIENLTRQLETSKNELATIEKNCKHTWDEPKDVSVHHEGGYIPGNESDPDLIRRSASYFSGTTTPKWSRTCCECGKTEFTTETKTEIIESKKRPVFN